MAAAYQIGYRAALIAAGAGALALADRYGWHATYTTMALLVAVGVATTLLAAEPAAEARASGPGPRAGESSTGSRGARTGLRPCSKPGPGSSARWCARCSISSPVMAWRWPRSRCCSWAATG